MIFDLVTDFGNVLDVMPGEHRRYHILRRLDEAVRRDAHFIERHPTTIFQCLWNTGWWYDCPAAVKHYVEPEDGWTEMPPWKQNGPKLHELMEAWRDARERLRPGINWLRSLRPPPAPLGSGRLAILSGHQDAVMSVAVSPDGTTIATASNDTTVGIWDASTGVRIAVLQGDQGGVRSVVFSSDGSQLVTGSSDGSVRLWDPTTGDELAVVVRHESIVNCLLFSPDGKSILSGSHDKTVRVWDYATRRVGSILIDFEHGVESLAFSPDGGLLAVVGIGEGVGVWNLATPKGAPNLLWQAKTSDPSVFGRDFDRATCMTLSPDGTRIAYGRGWGLALRETASGAVLRVLAGHEGEVTSVAFSPDGILIASGSADNTVRIWDVASGLQLAVLSGHDCAITSVAFSPDGKRIVSGSWDGTSCIWDAAFRSKAYVRRGHVGSFASIYDVIYSPDATRLSTASDDMMVRIWDSDQGVVLAVLEGHEDSVLGIAYSPDGARIASGSLDGTLRLWDAVDGTPLEKRAFQTGSVNCVAFSRDGTRIAVGLGDRTMRLLKANDLQELALLCGHEDSVECAAFYPDGRRVVSGSRDRTLRIWDTASGSEIAALGTPAPVATRNVRNESVQSVAVSPDGACIVSASRTWDSTRHRGGHIIQVWDGKNHQSLEVIETFGDVAAIAAGSNVYPVRVLVCGLETIIEEADSQIPVAYFPRAMLRITSHPDGQAWAGTVSDDLILIRLEGLSATLSRGEE